ncbi:MAG: hypothetical protein JNJ54_15640 [Myxococcaceae bacterium]|nr:hypothetical protein [Myxococcaceae bacterium]
MTSPSSKASPDQRLEELLASAREDEEAGRWDSADLKLRLALKHGSTPALVERLARVARRGAPAATPATQAAPSSPSPRTTPAARPAPPAPVVRTPPMPMMLFSVLQRQALVLGAGFATRYPHPWLVWELGPQRPAGDAAERNVLDTLLPSKAGSPKSVGSDPVCFALFGAGPLRVGRADGCSVVIDDVTFSRDLGLLVCTAGRWSFEATTGGRVELAAGSQLQNGDVTLSFETPESFQRRLAGGPR